MRHRIYTADRETMALRLLWAFRKVEFTSNRQKHHSTKVLQGVMARTDCLPESPARFFSVNPSSSWRPTVFPSPTQLTPASANGIILQRVIAGVPLQGLFS